MKSFKELQIAAKEVAEKAYAPYSKFFVGAAILTDDNIIFKGCNVENASYGLTVCAERIALFTAVAEGYTKFKALAIHTDTDIPFYPCGACCQVLAEFNPNLKIIVKWRNGEEILELDKLFPNQFKL